MGNERDLLKGSCDDANTATTGAPGTVEGALGAPRMPGYVLRTDVVKRGSRAFINVCGSEGIGRPSSSGVQLWTVPHGLSGPKGDPGKRPDKCRVYDFIVHPKTLQMIGVSGSFKKAVDDLAVESVSKQFGIRLDRKNLVFPDMTYKGSAMMDAPYVEKLAQVSVEKCGNELNEFVTNETPKEEFQLNEDADRICNGLKDSMSTAIKSNGTEQGTNENQIVNGHLPDNKFFVCNGGSNGVVDLDKMSSKKVLENGVGFSSNNNLSGTDENLSCLENDAQRYILPDYNSFQDKVSVTFIFDARSVERENVLLNVRSSQEIHLKMAALAENGLPLHFQCCLKFGHKCRFAENECNIDVSEMNVVLTIAKAEKSRGTWHTYFIGTSFQHLDVKDFVTADSLKRDLDALDMGDASPAGSCQDEEKSTKDTKAEEKESEDVPCEIVVVHERGLPRLHSILKQRSMSESSDDLSPWSRSMDRLVSTTTASDSESEEYDGSPVRFRPCFKKSVSFSEHIDETMFVVNQRVTQMHQSLKNKRRRMRKREQKHELKEARRRFRSSSESCAVHEDQDFIHCMLSTKSSLPFEYGENVVLDSANREHGGAEVTGDEFQDGGSEGDLHADEDFAEKNAGGSLESNAVDEDFGECKSGETCACEVEKIHKNLEGTSERGLEVIPEKSCLETCGGTSSDGGTGRAGVRQTVDLNGAFGGNMGMLSYAAGTRTSSDFDVAPLSCDESVFGDKWTSKGDEIKRFSDEDVVVSAFKLCDDDGMGFPSETNVLDAHNLP